MPYSSFSCFLPEVGVSQMPRLEALELLGCHGDSCSPFPPLFSPCSGHEVEEVDNTVTLIILAVVGGVIGFLIFILLVKKFIAFIIKKTQEKK